MDTDSADMDTDSAYCSSVIGEMRQKFVKKGVWRILLKPKCMLKNALKATTTANLKTTSQ